MLARVVELRIVEKRFVPNPLPSGKMCELRVRIDARSAGDYWGIIAGSVYFVSRVAPVVSGKPERRPPDLGKKR